MNACSLLSFNLLGCVGGSLLGLLSLIPLWGWLVIALVVIGVIYRFAGWPGLVGLGVAVGYVLRSWQDRKTPPSAAPAPTAKPKTTSKTRPPDPPPQSSPQPKLKARRWRPHILNKSRRRGA